MKPMSSSGQYCVSSAKPMPVPIISTTSGDEQYVMAPAMRDEAHGERQR